MPAPSSHVTDATVDPAAALRVAYDHTARVVSAVAPEQYGLPTPCSEWDVRQLLDHTIQTMRYFATALTGAAPAAGNPTDDGAHVAAFEAARDASLAAWSAEGALDAMVAAGPTTFPGTVAIGINLVDTLTHTWDLAVATGQDRRFDPAVSERALAAARVVVDDAIRSAVGFDPAVAIADDAPAADRLAAFLGRTPD